MSLRCGKISEMSLIPPCFCTEIVSANTSQISSTDCPIRLHRSLLSVSNKFSVRKNLLCEHILRVLLKDFKMKYQSWRQATNVRSVGVQLLPLLLMSCLKGLQCSGKWGVPFIVYQASILLVVTVPGIAAHYNFTPLKWMGVSLKTRHSCY